MAGLIAAGLDRAPEAIGRTMIGRWNFQPEFWAKAALCMQPPRPPNAQAGRASL
jgi:hypothetical protein